MSHLRLIGPRGSEAFFSAADIDQIRAQVTLSEVLEAFDLPTPEGVEGKIHCPLHNDPTPSFHVYRDNTWFCYGCGEGGDVFSFVRRYGSVSFGAALRWLSSMTDDLGPSVAPARHEKPLTDLTERHLTEVAAIASKEGRERIAHKWPYLADLPAVDSWLGVWFGVRFDRFSMWVPHFWEGRVVGIKVRPWAGSKADKLSVKGSTFTKALYRRPDHQGLPARDTTAVLVEGESDTWCMTKAFSSPSVSGQVRVYGLPAGAGVWKDNWAVELSEHRTVFLALDDDEPGRQAARKIRSELRSRFVEEIVPPGGRVAEALADGWDPKGLVL